MVRAYSLGAGGRHLARLEPLKARTREERARLGERLNGCLLYTSGTRVNDEDGAPTPLGALRFARLPKRRDDAAGEIALALAMRAARLAPRCV